MDAPTTYNQLLDTLSSVNQEHLIDFWDQLSEPQRQLLAAEIASIDFPLMQQLVRGSDEQTDWGALAARSESPAAIRLDANNNRFGRGEAVSAGETALRAGQVGAVVVAGGQGSRLGFPHPKGMFPLGPVSGRTLFQIHIDRILATKRRYGVSVPLFVMTSPATHEETVAYFQAENNCGLPAEDLIIFCQGTMPAVDRQTGKLLLEEKHKLFLSPDGHGGTVSALSQAGCFGEMEQRGIETLFYFQVDNPLVAIAHPALLGYHLLARSEMTTQVISKPHPLEPVGNVVSIDGRLQIIEYSDLPEDAADRRNADGSLAIWAGSIAVHVFDVAFLKRMVLQADSLPFHLATKVVPHVDATGRKIVPKEPNATKFERFIFDLLPQAKNALVVEVSEAEGFAPLKNASGAPKDTAETARAAMIAQHRRWLQEAGARVTEDFAVEISPRVALDEDELKSKVKSGQAFTEDTFLN